MLAERRRQAAGTLSGGEQQMLAIGRALDGAARGSSCSTSRRSGWRPPSIETTFAIIGGHPARRDHGAHGGAERLHGAPAGDARLRHGDGPHHARRPGARAAATTSTSSRPTWEASRTMGAKYFGASVPRREDPRLLPGGALRGRHQAARRMLHAALRAQPARPRAHRRRCAPTRPPPARPACVRVFTFADLERWMKPLPLFGAVPPGPGRARRRRP